jgi:GNAT superfamily N-acetyltransferase
MRQLGYDVAPADVAARLTRRDGRREVFVAAYDGKIAGWIAVSAAETFVEGNCAWIEGLVVDESARSQRLGTQLLDAAQTQARAWGCGEIRVLSNVVRERAHAFYRRNGYATVKAQYHFRKVL